MDTEWVFKKKKKLEFNLVKGESNRNHNNVAVLK